MPFVHATGRFVKSPFGNGPSDGRMKPCYRLERAGGSG